MPTGYCEPDDVRTALQNESLGGSVSASIIEPDIAAISDWLRKMSNRHWYDSSGVASDLVATEAESATNVRCDVPSGAHANDRQIHLGDRGVKYPRSIDGPYCRIPLPHAFVESLTTLEVRQRDGSVVDWTSASDKASGRGDDYYLLEEDKEGHGRSVLRVHEASIGPRVDYDGLLTLDYEYGLDAQDQQWDDVRRGVAALTAAQVIVEDDVLTAIPDNGQLVGIDTKAQRLLDRGLKYLNPYLEVGAA